jgi:hypothetical protein
VEELRKQGMSKSTKVSMPMYARIRDAEAKGWVFMEDAYGDNGWIVYKNVDNKRHPTTLKIYSHCMIKSAAMARMLPIIEKYEGDDTE